MQDLVLDRDMQVKLARLEASRPRSPQYFDILDSVLLTLLPPPTVRDN